MKKKKGECSVSKTILMTSGYSFEGRRISEYFGVYSGECALGTGFLSSLGAGFADFFGTNSTMYSDKLKRAKDYAIGQLRDQVIAIGGDAIIGLDIDYVSFSADIMGVIASGTAVKLENLSSGTQEDTENKYVISIYNTMPNFRPSFLYASPASYGESVLSLGLFHLKECTVKAVLADVEISDIFQRTTVLKDVAFIGFKAENARNLISDPVTCDLSPDLIRLIYGIKLTIKRYITADGLVVVPESEITYTSAEEEKTDSMKFGEEILKVVDSLGSAKEIYEHLVAYNEAHRGSVDTELLDIVKKDMKFERLYGNHKDSTIKAIKDYFAQCEENERI